MKPIIALGLVSLIAGCAPTMAQRTGARYPALAKGCPVEFVGNTGTFNAAEYEVLGNVTLSGPDGFTDAAKEELAPTVCQWGGTTVTIMASAVSMGTNATTFTVHRKRDQPAEPPKPLACLGTFVNRDGAKLTFDGSGSVAMSFNGNAAPCSTQGSSGVNLILTCGAGSQTGSFAADCSRVNLGGLDFTKSM